MYKEPEAMRMIHAIQEKFYEETKHLPAKEKFELIKKEVEQAEKEYGLHLRKVSHVR